MGFLNKLRQMAQDGQKLAQDGYAVTITSRHAQEVEEAARQIGAGARQRLDVAVFRTHEAALAVHHHRRREDQPPAARGEHLREQHRRPVVVV